MAELSGKLAEITAWAALAYPPADPPDPVPQLEPLSENDLISLFQSTTSRQHHLALVDQPEIRLRIIKSPLILAAVNRSWADHHHSRAWDLEFAAAESAAKALELFWQSVPDGAQALKRARQALATVQAARPV